VRQLYSNGQATFSVFVENSSGMPVAETTRAIGATTVASRTIALHGRSYQVTVVGAIPEATARQVAASVRPLP
jgi:sigma-E factor negative regulatory protein RseB